MKLGRAKNRGIALILVLLALLVLGTVAGAVVTAGSGQLMSAYSANQSLEAQYAARSAAWIKLAQVRAGDLNPLAPAKMPTSGAAYSAKVTMGPGPGKPAFPPAGTYYVEGVGISASGKEQRYGILATLTSSRWNNAIFGNNSVVMDDGSYTDAFNSDGGLADHSKASVATNNSIDGFKFGKSDSVVVGWANSMDPSTGKPKKKKDEADVELDPKANAQGPPGAVETVTVKSKGKGKAYSQFVTGAQKANMDPVVMPKGVPVGSVGSIDASVSPYPSIKPAGPTLIPPGAYYNLDVGSNEIAVLDVSTLPEGSTAEYVFHSIDLQGGSLQVLQPVGKKPITVKVYIDTGKGTELDKSAGFKMSGGSVVNPISKPINLQFLVAGEGTLLMEGHDDITDGLTPTAYWVAYAPEAEIEIRKGQVYGAVVANTVHLDGESLSDKTKPPAVVHYDVTLLEDKGNPPIFQVLSIHSY